MPSVLVVLSGGQDSTTCLFEAVNDKDVSRIEAVSFDYGQRHSRELDSAAFVYELARRTSFELTGDAERMPRYRHVKRLGSVFEGRSPLTDMTQSLETYTTVAEMDAKLADRVELTFVPGRNAIFLGLACSFACAWGLDGVLTGVNGADNANYPDCTPEFITAMEDAMTAALRRFTAIMTPLQGMTKKQVVEHGAQFAGLAAALAFTTTDYAGNYPPTDNHSSVLRASGFAEAGVEDPLILRARAEGLL